MYDEWIVPLKNQLHRMELSIQRLSSQQAAPVSPFTPLSSSVTSPSTPKSTLVTPQQPSVKHPPSHPGRDKPSILATSTPTNSESSPTEVGVAVDTPPSSSDGEGKLIIILCYLITCDRPWQTNHIAHKIVFELRPPVPTMTFELLILQI